MKKTISLSLFKRLQSLSIFLIVLLTLSCEKDENSIYQGDVKLNHQKQVDSFGEFGYTEINGTLTISSTNPDPIIDLSPLKSIKKVHEDYGLGEYRLPDCEDFGIEYVGGDLWCSMSSYNLDVLMDLEYVGGDFTISNESVYFYQGIYNLDELSSLSYIGGSISLEYCSIENLDVFSCLTEINGDLIVRGISYLNNIDGLSNLVGINGNLIIDSNHELTSIEGLRNISSIAGSFYLFNNISEINSLQNLTQVGGDFTIIAFGLEHISAMSKLTSLQGSFELEHTDLASLDFIQNLSYVGGNLDIDGNWSLTDFCGIENLIISNDLAGDYTVYFNAYNPTQQDIIDGNCSQ